MWKGWINLILGIWLIISGIISALQAPINMILVGILAALFGFWTFRMWQGIVNGILGLWLILSGIVFNLAVMLNFIIVGILMVVLSWWCALSPRHIPAPKAA